jgi:hypothetical protein
MGRKIRTPGVAIAILFALLANSKAFAQSKPEGVSLVVGPAVVSACEDEPLFLESTVVNSSSAEARFILVPTDWRFDIARENGQLLAKQLFFSYPGGLETYVDFRLEPGQAISFEIPFPFLLERLLDGVDGQPLRIRPGNYVVTWHCNEGKSSLEPYSEKDRRTWPWLTGSGTFRLEVVKRNEDRLAEAWGGIRDRFVQYEDRWEDRFRDPKTTLEWKALQYTLHAVEDEFALPYLEQMKAVDRKEMKRAPEWAAKKIQFTIKIYGHSPVSPKEMRKNRQGQRDDGPGE